MISVNDKVIPFFSIITTSYNRSYILRRALDSLINQSVQDWECIIVDDGSNDNTFLIAKEYCDKDKRFRYIYHSNRKQALSKNAGILAAAGLYITFLDSDDEYQKNHLEIRQSILRQENDLHFLYGGVKIIGDEYVPDANNPSKMIHLKDCCIGGTFFIRRDIIFELSGFQKIDYGDDTELFKRIEQNEYNMLKTNEATYIYHRDSSDSICNNMKN